MDAKVVVRGELPENPVIVEAFPSKGFVSTVAASHLISGLKMELVGCVESDLTSGITVIHKGKPMEPIRVYQKDDILLIYSEVIIPMEVISGFSKVLSEWFTQISPRQVILLAGITGVKTDKEHEILAVATDDENKKKLSRLKVNQIEDGIVTGVSSDLLIHCLEEKIPCIALLAETQYAPDPTAAASMLTILNSLLGLDVSVKDLLKAGKKIEEQVKNITDQLRRGKEGYKRMEEYSPMYG